jgi:hypothetical protein
MREEYEQPATSSAGVLDIRRKWPRGRAIEADDKIVRQTDRPQTERKAGKNTVAG